MNESGEIVSVKWAFQEIESDPWKDDGLAKEYLMGKPRAVPLTHSVL